MPRPHFSRFTFDTNYKVGYAETDDPRVVAILERDDYAYPPDYDSQAPALLGNEWGSRAHFTAIGHTSDVTDAWLKAFRESYDDDYADRFVSIFYGATAHHLRSSSDRYTWAVTFDTPDWRTAMGIDTETTLDRDNLSGEVSAYLDGDVYGIGYAVSTTRTTTETAIDLDDPAQGWETTMECYGFYGDDYAAESSLAFEHGGPTLSPFLDGTNPVTA
jgi:hypothetical protein